MNYSNLLGNYETIQDPEQGHQSMNNETSKQVEAFEENFFDWLLSKPSSTEVSEVVENQKPIDNRPEKIRVEKLKWEESDQLDSEEIDFPCQDESQLLTLREIPTVYNRFETLLQKRLKASIEAKPPRFPWENHLLDYEYEYPDVEQGDWVPPIRLWASQVKNLSRGRLPIPLTETVFAQLLESCQELVYSDLRPGSRLVRAVDNLFGGQSQSLNDLAGLVLAGRTRDGELIPNQVTAYNDATPKQQMLLSLLAAQEIFSFLTLTCRLNQSALERQWQTAVGWLTIKTEYFIPQDNSSAYLTINAQLPAAASLEIQARGVQKNAQRLDAGNLCIELFEPQPEQKYELIIKFLNWKQPLKFVVCLEKN